MPGKSAVKRQSQLQKTGTLIAAGVGVAFVGVIGWYVMHAGKAAAPVVVAPAGARSRAPKGTGESESLEISEVENPEIPVMDKKDPTRQIGLITCVAYEPQEGHRAEVNKPDAWLYLNDGRTLHVSAPKANVYMPIQGKEPESGTLSGGVTAELYEAREDGAKIVAGVDEPSLTFKTENLSFDSTLGQLSTKDRVNVVSTVADMTGTGMDLLFNQVKQRLELCRIGAGDNSAVLHSGAKPRKRTAPKTGTTVAAKGAATPGVQAQGSPQGVAPATGAATSAKAAKAPVETMYRADIDEGVTLSQVARELKADKLQVWARLIGGSLPEGAIAEVRGQEPTPPPPGSAPVPGGAAAPAPDGQATAAAPRPGAVPPARAGGDITLRWTGPCVIKPLDETPPELASEQLAARFTDKSAVHVSDSERGMTGSAASIEYGATTGKLLLAGKDAGQPRLDWPNAGAIETDRIEGDLVHGLIHIPAPGVLKQVKRDAEARWGEQANFTLNTRNGVVVGELKQALFSGGFSIADKDSTMHGGFGRADFVTVGDQPNVLSRLIVTGKASVESARSGNLGAENLDIEFAQPRAGEKAGDPEPRLVTASDHVVVAQKDSSMTTDWLEAQLGRTPAGQLDVLAAHAKGSVVITRQGDGLVASAGEMRADLGWDGAPSGTGARRQIVDLFEGDVLITRGETSTLAARQVRLDGLSHAVEVFGKGTFDHNDPQKKAVISARWETGMTFDDEHGLLTATGNAHCVSTPDDLSRDTIDADRIEAGLTPPAKNADGTEVKRDLLWAKAVGGAVEREGGGNASVTSERFIAEPETAAGRRREQLQYLEGLRINVDKSAGTVDVPGAGKLVIVDHRGGAPRTAPEPGAISAAGTQGDSLFTWTTSLHMEQTSGRADMDGGVVMTHRSVKDRQITNLECHHLTAVARTKGDSLEAQGASLISATATGAVYATVGPEAVAGRDRPPRKELGADHVEYDAIKHTLDSTAAPGGMVTILDPAKGSPVSAKRLFWDLASDRVEVRELGPVVTPR
jgi:hypothetical protein